MLLICVLCIFLILLSDDGKDGYCIVDRLKGHISSVRAVSVSRDLTESSMRMSTNASEQSSDNDGRASSAHTTQNVHLDDTDVCSVARSANTSNSCSNTEMGNCSVLFSGGGRGQLCAWTVNVRQRRHRLLATHRPVRSDSDMRYMSLCAFHIGCQQHVLFAACSDGNLRSALLSES